MIAGNKRSSIDVNCTSIDDTQSSSSEGQEMKDACDPSSSSTRSIDVVASAAVVPFSATLEINSTEETSNSNAKMTDETSDGSKSCSSSTGASSSHCIISSHSISNCSSPSIHASHSAEPIAELCYRASVHAELFFAPLNNYRNEEAAVLEHQLAATREMLAQAQQFDPVPIDLQHQLDYRIQRARERIQKILASINRLQMEQRNDRQHLDAFDECALLDDLHPFHSLSHIILRTWMCKEIIQSGFGRKINLQWARDWLLTATDILDELMATEDILSPFDTNSTEASTHFLSACIVISAMHLLPTLLHRFHLTMGDLDVCQSWLIKLTKGFYRHLVDYTPLLQLISAHGLDGASMKEEEAGSTITAAEMAHQFVGKNPQPSEATSTIESASSLNILRAMAMQQTEDDTRAERRRRKVLHAQFMHRFAAEWHSHSQSVRSLLMQAAPDRLIPDLVNICADYLDLDPADENSM